MNIESRLSGHWTDDQLIAYLYGVGPEDGHGSGCVECQARLAHLRATREAIEKTSPSPAEVSADLLAAQRRQIYAKLTKPELWWSGFRLARWTSACTAVAFLAGSLLYYQDHQHYQHHQPQQTAANKLSDAQLAQDVSSMSDNPEDQPTAPLQALFEE